MRRLLMLCAAGALLALGAGGCRVEVEYGNTAFACSDGECPDGFDCVQGLCVAEGSAVDEPDAAAPDAAAPDASLADAAPPDALPVASCDELFGNAPGYELCSETPETCSFNATTGGGNCDAICQAFDSTCIAAFDNVAEAICEPVVGSTDTCQTLRQTEICECARPSAP